MKDQANDDSIVARNNYVYNSSLLSSLIFDR